MFLDHHFNCAFGGKKSLRLLKSKLKKVAELYEMEEIF